MMLPSAVKTAHKYKKDVRKFRDALEEAQAGEDVSMDSMELADHVDEQFDGYAQAAGGIKKAISKVLNCCCCCCCCCLLLC